MFANEKVESISIIFEYRERCGCLCLTLFGVHKAFWFVNLHLTSILGSVKPLFPQLFILSHSFLPVVQVNEYRVNESSFFSPFFSLFFVLDHFYWSTFKYIAPSGHSFPCLGHDCLFCMGTLLPLLSLSHTTSSIPHMWKTPLHHWALTPILGQCGSLQYTPSITSLDICLALPT